MTISPRRKALLAKVHIAKKQLGLDDTLYRDILYARYSVTSSGKLSDRRLLELVEHFKSMGFKPKPARFKGRRPASGAAHKSKPHRSAAGHGEAKKMRALWLSLYHLGAISDPSEKALTSWARRVTGGPDLGLASLKWIKGEDAFKVIEGLKKMAERQGVDWSAYGGRHRYCVIMAQLKQLGHMPTMEILQAVPDLAGLHDGKPASNELLDGIIQELGALVRTARDKLSSTLTAEQKAE